MTILYERRIQVEVAGLSISKLRMTISIERQIDGSQDMGRVDIHNLSPEHEERIYQRGGPISISAGYPQTQALIFDGQVQRVLRMRENLTHITRIHLGDNVRSQEVIGGRASRQSYDGPVSIRQISKDLAQDIGLPLGPLDAIPPQATVNDWYWTLKAWDGLEALLKRVNCRPYESDGIIRINRVGETQADSPSIDLSQDSGLVGVPTTTDEGAEARMLLNPFIVLGCRLNIESSALTGSWKVVGIKHDADNWSGAFVTWVDLRPLENQTSRLL